MLFSIGMLKPLPVDSNRRTQLMPVSERALLSFCTGNAYAPPAVYNRCTQLVHI